MPAGRPPKPAALKAINGNPGNRPIPRNPEPTRGAPLPPGNLKGEALAAWGRIVPELDAIGLLTKVDRDYLVAYCESYATFDTARRIMAEDGPLVYGRDGGLVKNPAAQVMKDAADMMLKFGGRFGLSPQDRARLALPNSEPDEGGSAAILSILS